ncbi:MAG: formate-dependent phosphoribosylglycinamide formyltransferase [Desulfurococcaceae archaeon]|jgi:phosphoribosylglycinamide formyltransferase 2|nr:MAG: formate-dependent phosphoribosylglycinamide formyltransferase [Desulfurococcaceae archaeon]
MKPRDCIHAPMFEGSAKVLLLGSGELGKEIAIEAQRLGVEVIAVDRYDWAPAMHVAHRRYVVDMMNKRAIRSIVRRENPDAIIPEIEAISTEALEELEAEGYLVVPSARAVRFAMNRVELRRFAAEILGLPTTRYAFAENPEEVIEACERVGYPCLIKPEMSSSGHGHVKIDSPSRDSIAKAYSYAITHSRGGSKRVVVEEFVNIALEYTVLAYRYLDGDKPVTEVCDPIEQWRYGGYHYIESWQPPKSDPGILARAVELGRRMAEGLGGIGVFATEVLLTKDNRVLFNETAPRPHDTGLVTLVTQELSEFAVHVRAALGLPVPKPRIVSPGASVAVYTDLNNVWSPALCGLREALGIPGVDIRIFGKPYTYAGRRVAVALARGNSVEEALNKARRVARMITIREA